MHAQPFRPLCARSPPSMSSSSPPPLPMLFVFIRIAVCGVVFLAPRSIFSLAQRLRAQRTHIFRQFSTWPGTCTDKIPAEEAKASKLRAPRRFFQFCRASPATSAPALFQRNGKSEICNYLCYQRVIEITTNFVKRKNYARFHVKPRLHIIYAFTWKLIWPGRVERVCVCVCFLIGPRVPCLSAMPFGMGA